MTKKDSNIIAARKLLKQTGISSAAIPPAKLVAASSQLNKSLGETLNLIAFLKMNGQGYSPFPFTAKVLNNSYS